MVDSLFWVMHDLYHEPYGSLNNHQPHSLRVPEYVYDSGSCMMFHSFWATFWGNRV